MANSKLHELSGTRQLLANGSVAARAKAYVYDADSTDLQTIHSDSELSTARANPVQADGNGLFPYWYVGTSSYKTRLEDENGNVLFEQDDLPGATDLDSLSTDFSKPSTAVSIKTADYTVVEADLGTVVQVNTTGGNYTITLMSAVTAGNGKGVIIAHTGTANAVTVATVSSQTISRFGGAVETTYLTAIGESITLVSNGADWVVTVDSESTRVGTVKPYMITTAPAGYVLASGGTIGNASSSGTLLAAAHAWPLFELCWDNFADGELAVSSGRGASAAADFAANKNIAVPDLRGRGWIGLDNIGGSAASRLGTIITNETTNGASGGSETVALAEANHAAHEHTGSTIAETNIKSGGAGANTLGVVAGSSASGVDSGSGVSPYQAASFDTLVLELTSLTIASSGSGTGHSNMPPVWLGNWIIKL